MSLSSYSEYKESHVKWLGRVPHHWGESSLKYCVPQVLSGGTPDSGQPAYWATSDVDASVAWVSIGDMTRCDRVTHTERRITPEGRASKELSVLPPGTLIYSMYASVGKVAVLDVPAAINQAILGLVPDATLLVQNYLRYWLVHLQQYVSMFTSSNTQDNLNAAKVRAFPVVLPPIAEQGCIARFLDRETEKIDALIGEQRRLIELLAEKRHAVVSHAVTKGLNPDAVMKSSNVQWIGDVPQHWKVGALRFYARFRSGGTPSRDVERFWAGDIPWVKTGEIKYTTINDTEETISEAGLNSCSATLLPAGTLLMALYGQGVTRGRVAVLGVSAACNQACAAIELDTRLLPSYAQWFFYAAYPFVRDAGNENTQMNLSVEYVGGIRVTVPPLEEQSVIAAALDSDVAALDALMQEAQEAVKLLEERRTALISGAVTGQIDVRFFVAPEVS